MSRSKVCLTYTFCHCMWRVNRLNLPQSPLNINSKNGRLAATSPNTLAVSEIVLLFTIKKKSIAFPLYCIVGLFLGIQAALLNGGLY